MISSRVVAENYDFNCRKQAGHNIWAWWWEWQLQIQTNTASGTDVLEGRSWNTRISHRGFGILLYMGTMHDRLSLFFGRLFLESSWYVVLVRTNNYYRGFNPYVPVGVMNCKLILPAFKYLKNFILPELYLLSHTSMWVLLRSKQTLFCGFIKMAQKLAG